MPQEPQKKQKAQKAQGPGQAEKLAQGLGGGLGKATGQLIKYSISRTGIPGGHGFFEVYDWLTHPDQELKKWFSQETGIPTSLDPFLLSGKAASLVAGGLGRVYFQSQYRLSPKEVQAILVVDKTKAFEELGRNPIKFVFNKSWDWFVKGEVLDSVLSPLRYLGATAYEKVYTLPDSSFDLKGKIIHQPRNLGAPDYTAFQVPRSEILEMEASQARAAGNHAEADWKDFQAGASKFSRLAQSAWIGRWVSGGWLKEFGYQTSFDHDFSARPQAWQQKSGFILDANGQLIQQRAVAHVDLKSPLPKKGQVTGWEVHVPREFRLRGLRIDGVARFASDFLSVPGILEAVLTGGNLRRAALVQWNTNPDDFAPILPKGVGGSGYGFTSLKYDPNRYRLNANGRVEWIKFPPKSHRVNYVLGNSRGARVAFALDKIRQAAPLVLIALTPVNPLLGLVGLLKVSETFSLLNDLKFLGWVYNPAMTSFSGEKAVQILGLDVSKLARSVYLLTHPIITDTSMALIPNLQFQGRLLSRKVYPFLERDVILGWVGIRGTYLRWKKFRYDQKLSFRKSFLGRAFRRAGVARYRLNKEFINSRFGNWFLSVAWPALLAIYPIRLIYEAFVQRGTLGALGQLLVAIPILPLIGLYFTFSQLNNLLNNILQNKIIDAIVKMVGVVFNAFIWLPFRYLVWKVGGFLFKQFGWRWAGKLSSWAFRSLAKDALAKFALRIMAGSFRQAFLGAGRSALNWRLVLFVRGTLSFFRTWAAAGFRQAVSGLLRNLFSKIAQGLAWRAGAALARLALTLATNLLRLAGLAPAAAGAGAGAGVAGGAGAAATLAAIGTVILWVIIFVAVVTIIVGAFLIILMLSGFFWFVQGTEQRWYAPPCSDYMCIQKTAAPPAGGSYHPGDTINYTISYQLKKPSELADQITFNDYFLYQAKDAVGAPQLLFKKDSVTCNLPSALANPLVEEADPAGPPGKWISWRGYVNNPQDTDWHDISCSAQVDPGYAAGNLVNQAILFSLFKNNPVNNSTAVSIFLYLNANPSLSPSGWPVTNACIFQGPLGSFSHYRSLDQQAVDLAGNGGAELGSPVYATSDGTVLGVQNNGFVGICGSAGFGNCVVIETGEFQMIYAHLDTIDGSMRFGAIVAKGQAVGTVGTTGISPPAVHLHYGFVTSSGKILDTPYIPFHVPACSGINDPPPDETDDCNVLLAAQGDPVCF